MSQPQRVIITDCPHDGRHNGVEGYISDTYADGTAAIDIGFDRICIAKGWDELPPLERADVHFDEEPLEDLIEPSAPKRRGRPPKPKSVLIAPDEKQRHERIRKSSVPTIAETAAASSSTNTPLLIISERTNDRVSLIYSTGTSTIDIKSATYEEMERITAVVRSVIGIGEAT